MLAVVMGFLECCDGLICRILVAVKTETVAKINREPLAVLARMRQASPLRKTSSRRGELHVRPIEARKKFNQSKNKISICAVGSRRPGTNRAAKIEEKINQNKSLEIQRIPRSLACFSRFAAVCCTSPLSANTPISSCSAETNEPFMALPCAMVATIALLEKSFMVR